MDAAVCRRAVSLCLGAILLFAARRRGTGAVARHGKPRQLVGTLARELPRRVQRGGSELPPWSRLDFFVNFVAVGG